MCLLTNGVKILHQSNYSLLKIFHLINFCQWIPSMKIFTHEFFKNYIQYFNTNSLNFSTCVWYLVTTAVSPELMDQTKKEGDTASFTCQATGEPVPTINWYFNGVPVKETNTIKYTISMMSFNTTTICNTLTIMNVESSDVGTYTCNATNVISTDISSGVLTVNGELII